MRSIEGKQRYLGDIILLINLFALSVGATESAAIFELFPGVFCHKFTICRILKPLARKLDKKQTSR